MKKTIIFITLILLLLAGAGTVFALTRPPDPYIPNAYITEVEGKVEYKPAQEESWLPLAEQTNISPGDAIRTGDNASVTINFYDNSTSRLDSNTEILLDNLYINPENSEEQIVNIQLFSGQIWSRIIKLLDRNSEFQVMTSTTVATVRGTALDVLETEDGTNVLVDENTVEIETIEAEEITEKNIRRLKIKKRLTSLELPEGKEVEILRHNLPQSPQDFKVKDISEKMKKNEWLRKNKERDQEFIKDIEEKTLQRLQKETGPLPGNPLYKLKRSAEKIRLSLTPKEKRDELELRFAENRLKEGHLLEKLGNQGEAKKLIEEFNQKIEIKRQNLEKLPVKDQERIKNKIQKIEIEADKIKLRLNYYQDDLRESIEEKYRQVHQKEARQKIQNLIEQHPQDLNKAENREEFFKELRFLEPQERESILNNLENRIEVKIDSIIENNPEINTPQEALELIKEESTPSPLNTQSNQNIDLVNELYRKYLQADPDTRLKIKERARQELTPLEFEQFHSLINSLNTDKESTSQNLDIKTETNNTDSLNNDSTLEVTNPIQ